MSENAQSLPTVKLGNKDWPVREFVWRDQQKLLPLMGRIAKLDASNLTENDMKMLGDFVHMIISGKGSNITRESVDDLKMTVNEIIATLPVVMKQSDIEEKNSGEAVAPPNGAGTN